MAYLGTAGGDGERAQPWRQPLLRQVPGLPAYGAPDGVMLQFARDGRCVEAVTSRPGQVAVQRVHPGDEPKPLPTVPLAAAQRAAA